MKNMEEQKVEIIDITPDKSIYHKIGEANYSISDAIAELVDNSIDASSEEGIEIYIILDKKGEKIFIEDILKSLTKSDQFKAALISFLPSFLSIIRCTMKAAT